MCEMEYGNMCVCVYVGVCLCVDVPWATCGLNKPALSIWAYPVHIRIFKKD